MKIKYLFANPAIFSVILFAFVSRGADITALSSGNWSDTNIWNSGTVPGTNDDADIPGGIDVTVDTNTVIQYIYDSGTVTMGTNITLDVLTDATIDPATTLDTSATGNTVIYTGQAHNIKVQNYYNLVLNGVGTFWSGIYGSTAMTIAGNMTLDGTASVQEGGDFTIDGNLIVGTNCAWDCSSYNYTVVSNTIINGLFTDGDGASGNDNFNNVTINPSGTLRILDSTNWYVFGNMTNNGGVIKGVKYASINFNGTGVVTGTSINVPTLIINGTYQIATTINLATNTPTLNGTLVFDLANPGQFVLNPNAGSGPTFYYSGALNVINSGATPASGSSYQFFNAQSYGGSFATTSLPVLSGGLSWINNLSTGGSIAVSGGSSAGSPVIALSQNGNQLTLSWNSVAYPGYRVVAQTNSAGIGVNWSATGSGTNSPFTTTINPAGPPVFFRLSNP